jgi:hypothetical protein
MRAPGKTTDGGGGLVAETTVMIDLRSPLKGSPLTLRDERLIPRAQLSFTAARCGRRI